MTNKFNPRVALIATKQKNVFKILLNLELGTRVIGKLDTNGDGTLLLKRSYNHLFYKTNSLGINLWLLNNCPFAYKWILINYAGKKLYSSRNYYLMKGQVFQFSAKGFEPQAFLPIDELNLPTARKFEESLTELNSNSAA